MTGNFGFTKWSEMAPEKYGNCVCTAIAHGPVTNKYILSVRPSVRPSVTTFSATIYAQQGGQKAIPTGSVPHWLDFKKGDFRKSTAFKSYGVKTKRTSQYANEHDLPRPDSARFSSTVEAVEVTRRASIWSWFAKNTTYRRS